MTKLAGYYDPNKDYSAAIEEAKKSGASASTIQQLQNERQNKIDDKYSGKEPTMYGSNKTYSELSSSGSSGSQREIDNAVISQPGGSLYYDDGTKAVTHSTKGYNENLDGILGNYGAAVNQLMNEGYIDRATGRIMDWEAVGEWLNQSELKAKYEGGTFDRAAYEQQFLADFGNPVTRDEFVAIKNGTYVAPAQTATRKPAVSTGGSAGGSSGSGGGYNVGLENVWGGGSGGSNGGGQNSDLTAYLKEAFAQQMAAELAALKSTYEQNAADLDAQGAQIGVAYDGARNQVAAQNDLSRMSMNEYGIMQGLNTGATGQMALAQNATLQGNLAGLSAREAQALADNALEKVKLTSVYRNAADQAEAEGKSELAAALYEEAVRQEGISRQEAAAAQEQANWLAQFNAAQQADARDYAYDLVKMMLSNGIIPDETTLAAAGMSGMDVLNQMYQQNAEPVVDRVATPTAKTYDNGTLTPNQIITLQQHLNQYLPADEQIAVDGKWGAATKAAAGGMSAAEYANIYYKQNAWSGRSDR